jgi:hypothetical protein
MVEDIKIIDDKGIIIKPDKKNLVCIPVNGRNEFVTIGDARDLIRIIQGQLNILKVQQNERKTGSCKCETHIDSKTGCST